MPPTTLDHYEAAQQRYRAALSVLEGLPRPAQEFVGAHLPAIRSWGRSHPRRYAEDIVADFINGVAALTKERS